MGFMMMIPGKDQWGWRWRWRGQSWMHHSQSWMFVTILPIDISPFYLPIPSCALRSMMSPIALFSPLEHNCWARLTDFPLILKNLVFSLGPCTMYVSPCIGPVHVHRRWFAVSRISFTNWRFTVHSRWNEMIKAKCRTPLEPTRQSDDNFLQMTTPSTALDDKCLSLMTGNFDGIVQISMAAHFHKFAILRLMRILANHSSNYATNPTLLYPMYFKE